MTVIKNVHKGQGYVSLVFSNLFLVPSFSFVLFYFFLVTLGLKNLRGCLCIFLTIIAVLIFAINLIEDKSFAVKIDL